MTAARFKELLEETTTSDNVRSYSGRGMRGTNCVAICLDSTGDLALLGGNLMNELWGSHFDRFAHNSDEAYERVRHEVRELLYLLANTCHDNMPLGIVAYWPSLEWEGME